MKMDEKNVRDYVPKREPMMHFSGRVPRSRMEQVRKKMEEDGITKIQDLLDAMLQKYLDEK